MKPVRVKKPHGDVLILPTDNGGHVFVHIDGEPEGAIMLTRPQARRVAKALLRWCEEGR